jgi:hypothetical protein
MSDIDAEKLEAALAAIEGWSRGPNAEVVLAAEVVRWCIVGPAGGTYNSFHDEGQARCACPVGWQVVKLTGTARVRV